MENSLLTVNRNAFRAADEAQMLLADAYQLRADRESSPIKSGMDLFRKLLKKTYKKARDQTDSRVLMEWMVRRTEELSGTRGERLGQSLSEDTLEMLLAESRCKGPTANCNIPTVNQFRTIDGTCNNLREGKQTVGASFTEFSRILKAVYEDGIGQPLGFQQAFIEKRPFAPRRPSARLISTTVIQDINKLQPDATLMLMQWGQFLDHDYAYLIESSTLSGEEIECNTCEAIGECQPIQVPEDDPQFGLGTIQNGNCLSFIRAGVSCVRQPGTPLFDARQQLNQITHWIDASNVYGSLPEEEQELREFRNGLLREGNIPGTLPEDPNPRPPCPGSTPCFRGGDLRANEQVVLTVMHTIFLREHNRIARQLSVLNPRWDDERIYQEARKIVGAIAQVITYQEYLPEMLGERNLQRLLGRYTGYNDSIDASLPNSFGAAAYRVGHSQVQEAFTRIDVNGRTLPSLPLVQAFFNPGAFFANGGTDTFLRGLLSQQSRKIDEFVTRTLTNRLFQRPREAGMDLASLNIQRGRDHGLPSYRAFRNFCAGQFGLRGEIENPSTLHRLRELYNSEDDIDLWVGGLAETPLPGARIGPTFACIFAITFKGLREGDRFYYENPGVFTPEQLNEIKKASLSKIICDNGDDIREAQPNAFSTVEAQRPCAFLPSIDLSKWSEESTTNLPDCYVKVLTRVDSTSRASASVYTRPSNDMTLWNLGQRDMTAPDNSRTRAACLRFTCPSVDGSIKIGVRARSTSGRCRLEEVVGSLPLNRSRNLSTYLGVIRRTFGPNVGVYNSLRECQSGGGSLSFEPVRGAALSFRCP